MLHAGDNQQDLFSVQQNYLFVFMIVGLTTLVPLIIITAVVIIRTGIPRICRFLCLCATMLLGSGVAAMLLIYFALSPQDVHLARGDQVIIGQSSNGYTTGSNQIRYIACDKLSVQTNQRGVTVWAVSVSLNRGSFKNYSLTISNWTLPTYARLRLGAGDVLRVRNWTSPVKAVLLKGEDSWKTWSMADTHQLGYEKCCAWKDIQPKLSGNEEIEVDEDDMYTVILREDTVRQLIRQREPEAGNINFSGAIDLVRVRWEPTPCDPVICDGSTKLCHVDGTPKRYVIDYAVETMSAPPYEEAVVRLICHPRGWALGLMFSVPPISILILTLIIWKLKERRKEMQFFDTVVEETVPKTYTSKPEQNDRQNPAFEMDIV